MKNVLRKTLSIALALCLLTALMPFSVLAAEGDVCQIVETGTGYATLDSALAAVYSGETINLLEDIDYGGIVIEDKSITFDLNGCTLNVVNNAEAGTERERSGLYVRGNATVALTGEGEFNVTGSQYGVYVEGDAAGNAAATVTNAVATGNDGCAAYAYGENAVITVEGDVTATGTAGVGATGESSGRITVEGNVTATADNTFTDDYECAAVTAWDDGEVIVDGNITATGTKSIGVLAAGSCVSVDGDVTGVLGGAYATTSSSIEITGNVRSTDVLGFGVQACDNCSIDVGGNVESGGTGVMITGVVGLDSPSQITVDGVIRAPAYIQIGYSILCYADYDLDPTVEGYRIYTIDSNLGAVLVADFAGGDGSETNPYLIETVDQLNDVRNCLETEHAAKHFKLITNLDLNVAPYNSGEGWEPIGNREVPFTGTFDGDGHTISNLLINRGDIDDNYMGLFGYTGSEAEIRDLGLVDVDVTGSNWVGGLVGQNEGSIIDSYIIGTVAASGIYAGGLVGDNNGAITNCHAQATVTSSDDFVGGLAGGNFGPITDSYATGAVTGDDYVGGLVGLNPSESGDNGEITASYSTCTVEGTWDVGGLVGGNSGLIAYSYATGTVTGEIDIGGLAGGNYSSITNSYATGDVAGDAAGGLVGYNTASIINCYAIGAVEIVEADDIGGLVGDNGSSGSGTATNSYWDTETSGLDTSVGGEGKPTAEMKQKGTYEEWDFDTIWGINASDNGGYPFLRWQGFDGGPTSGPPVLSAVSVSAVTQTTAALNFTSDKAGTYYYLVYAAEDTVPDAATIKAQGEATAKGTGAAVAAVNNVAVISLTASTAYKAYVIVEDAEENISNVAVIGFTTLEVVPAAPTVPAAPQNFTATPGDTQVALSWNAPASNGGSAVTKYQVSNDNGANWTDVGLNTSNTFTGLTNGTEYTFKVRAVNSVGNGAEASAAATPTAPAPTQPGQLYTWGGNYYGQLGDGYVTNRNTPLLIGTDEDWTAISAGCHHTVALKTDGSLWAWGWNNKGQLGDGTFQNRTEPVRIGSDTDWAAAEAGDNHTVALKTDGSLWAWGGNNIGQLGDDSTENRNVPTLIDDGSTWIAVSAGVSHTVALQDNGSLWAWGSNYCGQLGNGNTEDYETVPTLISNEEWAAVSAGSSYTVALKTDGSLWAWGLNDKGQLGDGTVVDKNVPTQVGSDTWLAAAAGDNHAVGIKADGSLWAWGGNEYGELGNGSSDGVVDAPPHPVPVQIGTDIDWISVTAGYIHNVAFKTDGSLWLWGHNGTGQLGDGTAGNFRAVPQRLDGAGTWLAVACGDAHTAALLEAALTAPTAPTVPQNFTATPGDTQVVLSWTAPTSDGGSAVTKYQVLKDNGETWTDVGLNTSYTFTGLTNGTEYTFKVRAVNSAGNGAEASIAATPESAPVSTHTVNFYSNGSLYAGKTVTSGSALGANWPNNPTRSGYSFGGWFTGQNGAGALYTSTTIITADVNLYAKWTYNNNGGGSSTSSGGSSAPANYASKFIETGEGGGLGFGNATVEVPAGVLPDDATLKVKQLTNQEADDLVSSDLQVSLDSDIYEITTTGNRSFGDKTLTIRIAYDPAQIAEGEQPVIRYRDETSEQWVDLPTAIEQGADGKWYAVTQVNHLTKFAVFSAPVPEPVTKVVVLTLGQQAATVDGSPYTLDGVPFATGGRTMVPIRFVSEALGAEVDWNAETRQVIIKDGDKEIILTLGSAIALINGQEAAIDAAPYVTANRTFVPLRFVSETLGAQVDYDPATKQITITG